MVPKQQIFIGLGSNIDPETNLRKAALMLHEHFPNIRFSSVYRTAAREVETQEDFLNAVALIQINQKTNKPPQEILSILQSIERALHKSPPYRFGPRTIDLDLLLYADSQFSMLNSQLVVPHPRMHERRFVLEPLCELIDSTLMHPVLKKSWKELLSTVQHQKCLKISVVL